MAQEIRLTRRQIEQLAIYLSLNQNIMEVDIQQSSKSGIGLSHRATYHFDKVGLHISADITDVETW